MEWLIVESQALCQSSATLLITVHQLNASSYCV